MVPYYIFNKIGSYVAMVLYESSVSVRNDELLLGIWVRTFFSYKNRVSDCGGLVV